MRERPRVGDVVTHEVTVTEEMTARLFGRQIHPVYATAWMVRHVEEAGRLLIEPYLRPLEEATGYRIALTHERPAAVGERLIVTARAVHVDERECVAEVEVRSTAGVVGRGTFVQRYIDKDARDGPRSQGVESPLDIE